MYWTNAGNFPNTKIQRADLDGSNVEDLLVGFQTPHGIDLDLTSGKMYWTDNGAPGTVQRADLDGSNLQTLVAQGAALRAKAAKFLRILFDQHPCKPTA